MFMQFVTPKGEKVILSTEKIMLITEEKKGVTVIIDDGTPIPVSEKFESVSIRLNRGNFLPQTTED